MLTQTLSTIALVALLVAALAVVRSVRRRRADRASTQAMLRRYELTAMRERQAKLAELLPAPRPRSRVTLPMGVGASGQEAAHELLEHRAA